MTTIADAAHEWQQAGCSVVPVRDDGSKHPVGSWKHRQTTPATAEEVDAWFADSRCQGVGVVCGAVSGNMEMFEAEGRAVTAGLHTRLAGLLDDHDAGELWKRIDNGYVELTPSGGFHWYYRVDGPARRNTKLAQRPATDDELAANPKEKVKVLLETRGEAGFTVVAPSAGSTHPTGAPWVTIRGNVRDIPTLSIDERDLLYAVAALLDEMPTDMGQAARSDGQPHIDLLGGSDVRPGDDFNARATWAEILTGWTCVGRLGPGYAWRRPGKDTPGISATTGQAKDGIDRFYCFSTATEFVAEKPYSKFAAYVLLEHNGDYSAAARALHKAGYGHREQPKTRVFTVIDGEKGDDAGSSSRSSAGPTIDGNLAHDHATATTTFQQSDDGNAQALIARFGKQIRYCPERGRWLHWDGTRWHWQPPSGGHVREHAKSVARSLPEGDKASDNHKKRALGSVGTTAMLTQAETDRRVTVALDELDAHPWELNTPAGIADLRTGQITPADPARMHTRVTSCAPDFDADTTTWDEFLIDTFGGDQALIGYLQRLVGYSAVGKVGPHVLPFAHGSGGNGKGVFLESLTGVLGDYATTAPVGFLMAQTYSQHETEIARLAGARMVVCSEVNEGDRFDEAKVKQLTGGDSLTARFMRADHFSFTPTHQLWLVGNTQPAVRTGGRSFWRRLRLIPFQHEVQDDQVVDDFQTILATQHGPALLAWIIAGASEYARGGLGEPASVKAATDEYEHDQDTVRRFLEERCHVSGNPQVKLKAAVVRDAYEKWCASEGVTAVNAKALGLALRRHGVWTWRDGGGRYYLGITLLADDNTSQDTSQDKAREWFG